MPNKFAVRNADNQIVDVLFVPANGEYKLTCRQTGMVEWCGEAVAYMAWKTLPSA